MSSLPLGVGNEAAGLSASGVIPLARTKSRCKTIESGTLIAIVDDDKWVLRSLQRLMKSAGFKTEAFTSAEDFLESHIRHETTCVILDLKLPGMSGLDLQRCLTAERLLPIIFISGNCGPETRRQALQAGAIAFLDKPFGDQALLDAVHSALQ